MRLLLTTDTVGGVWDYSVTLARQLVADGHAVLLAVLGRASEDRIAELPEEIAIECRDLRLEWMADSADDVLRGAYWLASIAHTWGADIVHLNQMAYPGLVRFDAPTLVAVHSDVRSWFSEVLGSEPLDDTAWYSHAVTAGLRAADIVVTPTRYQADLVTRHYGRAVDHVIHNAAEQPSTPSEAARGPFGAGRRRTHRTPSAPLTAARAWDAAKGMSVLDRALELLGDAAPTAHLLGPLDGPGGERFDAVRLRCHGQVGTEEVRRWMASATIYAAPSLYEPFGLAPLEAALHGCALLLSDIGSFRELWDGCAAFFAKGDAEALATSLEALLADPAQVAHLGAAARQRAVARFTPERFAREYVDLYREMTGLARDYGGMGGPVSAVVPRA